MTQREIMDELKRGGKVTNGSVIIELGKGGVLHEIGNDVGLSMIPFNANNQDEWEVYIEPSNEPLYYQWCEVSGDKTTFRVTPEWFREDVKTGAGYRLYGEGHPLSVLMEHAHDFVEKEK